MSRVVCPKTWPLSLCIALICPVITETNRLHAATLILAGLDEGAQIALPSGRATTNLSLTAVVSGAPDPADVRFTLEWQGAVLHRATSAPPYSATFTDLAPGKYFLTATYVGSPPSSSDLSFDILPARTAPVNDRWLDRTPIAALGALMAATNVTATAEPEESSHAGNGGGHSIWWSWQANTNGWVTATTAGSDFDTVVAIYTGTNASNLVLVAANDDAGLGASTFSQAAFAAVSGTTYHLAVDGAMAADGSSAAGRVELRLLAATPPSVEIQSPTDGSAILVADPVAGTNVTASVTISDPSGVSLVEYRLDSAGLSRSGTLAPPYQASLNQLPPGDYLLSVLAWNSAGLACPAHVGFSVVPVAPEILFVDSGPMVSAGFQFVVQGRKGMSYEVQASTNLVDWNGQNRWTNFDGVQRARDTNVAGVRERFYRVVAP